MNTGHQKQLKSNEQQYSELILRNLSNYTLGKELIKNLNNNFGTISRQANVTTEEILAFTILLQALFYQIELFYNKTEKTWEDLINIVGVIQKFKNENIYLENGKSQNQKIFEHPYFSELNSMEGLFSQRVTDFISVKKTCNAYINYWSKHSQEYSKFKTESEKQTFFKEHKNKLSAQQSLGEDFYVYKKWNESIVDRHLIFDFDGVLADTFEPYAKVVFLYELNSETKGDFEKCKERLSNQEYQFSDDELLRAKKWIWAYSSKPHQLNADPQAQEKNLQKIQSWGKLLDLIGYEYFDTFIESIKIYKEMGFKISAVSNTPEEILNRLNKNYPGLFENLLGRETNISKLEKIKSIADDLKSVIYITDAPTDVFELKKEIPIILGAEFGFFNGNLEKLQGVLPNHHLIKDENTLNAFFEDPREPEFRNQGFTDFTSQSNWENQQLEILEGFAFEINGEKDEKQILS